MTISFVFILFRLHQHISSSSSIYIMYVSMLCFNSKFIEIQPYSSASVIFITQKCSGSFLDCYICMYFDVLPKFISSEHFFLIYVRFVIQSHFLSFMWSFCWNCCWCCCCCWGVYFRSFFSLFLARDEPWEIGIDFDVNACISNGIISPPK